MKLGGINFENLPKTYTDINCKMAQKVSIYVGNVVDVNFELTNDDINGVEISLKNERINIIKHV